MASLRHSSAPGGQGNCSLRHSSAPGRPGQLLTETLQRPWEVRVTASLGHSSAPGRSGQLLTGTLQRPWEVRARDLSAIMGISASGIAFTLPHQSHSGMEVQYSRSTSLYTTQ